MTAYDDGYNGHPKRADYDDKDHKDWIDGDYDRWTRNQEATQ
ncbi:hypothetical protein [Gordonia sp. 852002-10350_SCH5691597]|nr:hypothetical protein [Gordonia sp. 852002-10350_SCH5691597]